jgi:hypothetical protein
VTAYDEVLIELNATIDLIPGVSSNEALTELLSRSALLAAFNRAAQACQGLQAAATSVSAVVDLECQS